MPSAQHVAATATSVRPGGRSPAKPRTPSAIIDEVVTGVREQESLKFAGRVLTLYQEFKAGLVGTRVASAAQGARHSTIDFYTTVAQCAVRVGRFELVDGVVEDMIQQDVERTLNFYEIAMKQLAGQKQYKHALAVYDRLAADGLEPSAVTCSCLIGFAAEVGELERAVAFFQTLSSKTTPSIRAYMTVLRVHANRRDWPASLAVFHDMISRGAKPDCLVLNFILATGVATDRLDAAVALLEEAENLSPPISDVVSYNTIVKGYAQRVDAEGAINAITRMRARGLRPNSITFNTAMDAAVRGGMRDEAWRLLRAMRGAGLRADRFTCSILIKGFAKGATPEHVRCALDLLGEVGSYGDGALFSALHHSVLEAAASLPDAGLTAEAFAQMRRRGVVPSSTAQRLLVQVLPHAEAGAVAAELAEELAR